MVQGKSICGLHKADHGVVRGGTNVGEMDGIGWFGKEQVCENIGIKEKKGLVACKLRLVFMLV